MKASNSFAAKCSRLPCSTTCIVEVYRSASTKLLLRAQPNVRIEPMSSLGPRFHERAPHGHGVAGEGQLEVDRFLTAELCLGGVRRAGMRVDELLPSGRGACFPCLLKRF